VACRRTSTRRRAVPKASYGSNTRQRNLLDVFNTLVGRMELSSGQTGTNNRRAFPTVALFRGLGKQRTFYPFPPPLNPGLRHCLLFV
jgi:hypothetical protein